MNVHPDANVLPEMSTEEYARLSESIARDGLLDPITTLNGMVLDGRHRDRICAERNIEPRYEEWNAACGLSPLEWVIAKNLHRRQLSKAQCAALAVELKPRLAKEARERQAHGRTAPGKTLMDSSPEASGTARDIAGATFGVSGRSVSRLEEVRAQDEDVFQDVKRGEKTIHAARREVGLRSTAEKKPPVGADPLREALAPLRKYLKHWTPDQLSGVWPRSARSLLKEVQEVNGNLFEVERALEERAIFSRALR